MKTKKMIMSFIALFNIALIVVFALSVSTNRFALITLDQNLLTKIKKQHDESDEMINDLSEQVSLADNEVQLIQQQVSMLLNNTTGDPYSVNSNSTNVTNIVPNEELPEIRVTYIIQQVNLKVSQYMKYSEDTMPCVNRTFPINTTEDYMIDALVTRFKSEHNLYGRTYYRLEYVGAQYSATGNAVFVFKCYFN